jgi:hypothetical protein
MISGALIGTARADLFTLRNGGQVRGTWLNADQQPVSTYLIETEHGARIKLAKTQVRSATRQNSAELTYEQLAPRHADTVEEQWKLAEWCRENGLDEIRQHHLQRIIELAPNHAGARRGLGYSQVRGQWVTKDEHLTRQGYQLYRGRWRSPQEIQTFKEREHNERAEKKWIVRLKHLREDLATDKAAESRNQILSISDRFAVPGLRQCLEAEKYRAMKIVFIQALGQIADGPALSVLIERSLNDPDDEIFYECLDQVVRSPLPEVIKGYVDALKHNNNHIVNRAAIALGDLKDKTTVEPLIEALVTTHKVVIPGRGGGSAETVTTTFANSSDGSGSPNAPFGGTGLSLGDDNKTRYREMPNQEVLNTLVKLSGGASFGFDKQAWRFWLAAQRQQSVPRLNSRRD